MYNHHLLKNSKYKYIVPDIGLSRKHLCYGVILASLYISLVPSVGHLRTD